MKKVNTMLAEYAKNLSDEDLAWLRMRVTQNLFGDRADVIAYLSRNREIDRWLSLATTADELFDSIDLIGQFIVDEYDKR
jgi:hypothetical protein